MSEKLFVLETIVIRRRKKEEGRRTKDKEGRRTKDKEVKKLVFYRY
jgi:hypothetical protein